MWTPDQWYAEARGYAQTNRDMVRGHAAHWLKTLEKALPEMPHAELVRRLQAANAERLDAVPSLTRYPELRGVRELIAAEWRGTRDGADLDDALLASYCGAAPFYHRFIANGKAMTGCSYIYFHTSDVGPILANNLDTVPEEPYLPPHWPAVSEHLLIGTVSSGVYMDEESPEIFPAPVFKLMARYGRTTEEAVELLTRYNHFWGPANVLVVDRAHRIAMIEKTACRIAARYSDDGFGFITAMTQEDAALHAYVDERRHASVGARGLTEDCDDYTYWANQDKRRHLMNELLEEARATPTLEKLRQMIQFRDPVRGNVAGNGEPTRPGVAGTAPTEHTIKTQIWLLREGRAQWWTRDNETGTPSWENRREDITFDDVWLWE